MPTPEVAKAAKAEKSKATPKSANPFKILTDQDKENDPLSNSIQIQVQVERRPMVNPRNTEVGIPIRRPRKVNSKQGNPKDSTHALINTPNTLSAVAATLTIDINISAPLTSAPSQGRAEPLASEPLFVPPEGINSQKDETLSNATLRMLYQWLELQEKHLEFQNRHIKYQDGLL